MLGEISPHHDYCNSKSSSETPPSYNQLNYNENLQRFFDSKPKTLTSDENSDIKMNSSLDEEEKSCPQITNNRYSNFMQVSQKKKKKEILQTLFLLLQYFTFPLFTLQISCEWKRNLFWKWLGSK